MSSRNVDRLSNLPEEVLSHILSSMPTRFAVRTSVLSKTWRYKWTCVTNFDFHDFHPFHGLKEFSEFVDRVFDLSKTAEIGLFRLIFKEMWVPRSSVSKWIEQVVRLNVRELDIHVILLELPISLFTCKTLTNLRIEHDGISDCAMDWPTAVNLPCLKTLDIAVFDNPSRNALRLIPGCPVLESLSFKVDYRSDEEEYRFSIPTLKHMKLSLRKSDTINKVVLNVPSLEDLCISGTWCSHFVMEDFPSLASVTFSDFRLTFSDIQLTFDNLWIELLKGITGAQSLSFSILYSGLPDAPLPNFPNLKHLELTGCSDLEPLIIFRFLESCSELEHLSIKQKKKRSPFDKPEQSCWIEPHSGPSCMLKNLSTIKYEICMVRIDDILFLEYMLGNAEVLRKLTITCKSERVEDEMGLCDKLLKCQRASRYCEIHFVGNLFDSAATC